eukprot:Nk52_evm43s266 gene=Nk52_evmTU43s266
MESLLAGSRVARQGVKVVYGLGLAFAYHEVNYNWYNYPMYNMKPRIKEEDQGEFISNADKNIPFPGDVEEMRQYFIDEAHSLEAVTFERSKVIGKEKEKAMQMARDGWERMRQEIGQHVEILREDLEENEFLMEGIKD